MDKLPGLRLHHFYIVHHKLTNTAVLLNITMVIYCVAGFNDSSGWIVYMFKSCCLEIN